MTKAGPVHSRLLARGILFTALLTLSPAAAQPPATSTTASTDTADALSRLAALQATLADPDTVPAERLRAEREAVDLRIALADAHPADDRAATWLVDAAAGLIEPLARDGTQASVLMGIPTPSQRTTAAATARRALDLLTRAETTANTAVEHLQAILLEPAQREKGAEEARRVEAHLAALVDVELTQRIPYHRGLCHALLAACEDDPARRTDNVRAAVAALSDREIGSMTGEAARRVVLAAALLLEPRGLDELRTAALEQLAWVDQRAGQSWGGDDPDPAAAVGRLTAVQARMGQILATRPPAAVNAARQEVDDTARDEHHAGAALLLAEAHARLVLADPAKRVSGSVERAAAAADIVLHAYRAMPDASDAQHAARERVRLAAYDKVAALSPSPLPAPAALPAEMALANAIVLSRRAAETSDPELAGQTVTQAEALLESLATRPDTQITPPIKADALWELASLASRGDDPRRHLRAIEALLDLAYMGATEDNPRAPHGPRRSAKAVAAGVQLGRFASTQPAVRDDAAMAQRLRASYRPLLQMMLAQSPAEADIHETDETVSPDVWRAELARVLLDDALAASAHASATAETAVPEKTENTGERGRGVPIATLDEVLALMKPVRDADVLEHGGSATVQRAFDAARSALAPDASTLRARIDVQERELAWRLDRPPADPADARAPATRLRLVELLLDASDKAALAHLHELSDADGPRPGVDPLRLRLAQARALRLDGKRDQAFQQLLDVATELDRPVGVEGEPGFAPRPDLFWSAWCEMLEILALDNLRRGTPNGDEGEGDRSATIRLHIRNLELIDPALGGERFSKRIRAVEASL